MMISVSNLSGGLLNAWVAREICVYGIFTSTEEAEDSLQLYSEDEHLRKIPRVLGVPHDMLEPIAFYATDPRAAIPIIIREKIATAPLPAGQWTATIDGAWRIYSSDPMEAAMRAQVLKHYGPQLPNNPIMDMRLRQ